MLALADKNDMQPIRKCRSFEKEKIISELKAVIERLTRENSRLRCCSSTKHLCPARSTTKPYMHPDQPQ